VAVVAAEEVVSTATLSNGRKQARREGRLLPDHDDSPEGWSAQDKFNAVLETAALSEAERSEPNLCHGLDPEPIRGWRETCAQANNYEASRSRELQRQQREERRRVLKARGRAPPQGSSPRGSGGPSGAPKKKSKRFGRERTPDPWPGSPMNPLPGGHGYERRSPPIPVRSRARPQ